MEQSSNSQSTVNKDILIKRINEKSGVQAFESKALDKSELGKVTS